ncbi:MAG TPA: Calx-beta domain-containing protein, partial [Mycobacterium sp.]|nr:Calx-beta domain-containing protein [Mycobacterium sp.]
MVPVGHGQLPWPSVNFARRNATDEPHAPPPSNWLAPTHGPAGCNRLCADVSAGHVPCRHRADHLHQRRNGHGGQCRHHDHDFTITQSGRAKSSVHYATASGTATSPSDFLARSGTVKFSGGHRKNKIAVTIVGDTLDEANEQFTVRLSSAVGATIANGVGVGTITDNDAAPTVSTVGSLTVPEGGVGDTTFASVEVTLSAVSGRAISVDYATVAGTATAGTDYTTTSGTLDFPVGATTRSVVVPVIGDADDEGDETFDVDLSNPVNATLGTHPAVVTIQDNDPIPVGSAVFNVTGASVREGTGGTKKLTFTVTRSGETTTAVTVDYATTSETARAPSDYVSAAGT